MKSSGLAELLGSLGGIDNDDDNKVLLKDEAAQSWREKFVPIPNLKAGDKVCWKSGCKDKKTGDYGDVFEVFSVIDPPIQYPGENGSNHELDILDFSIAQWDGENFLLYAYDSRRFERVEDK